MKNGKKLSEIFTPEKLKALWAAIIATALKTTGLKGWLMKTAAKYGGQFLVDLISGWIKKEERKQEQTEAREKFEEVAKKPETTEDDFGKAYEDMINSGRKK